MERGFRSWGAGDGDAFFRFPLAFSLPHPYIRSFLALGSLANSCRHDDDGREDLSDAMSIVHSKVLGGANPHGSGWGILQVGIGAYRYVSPFLIKEMRHDNIETFAQVRNPYLGFVYSFVKGGSSMPAGPGSTGRGAVATFAAITEKDAKTMETHRRPRRRARPFPACTDDGATVASTWRQTRAPGRPPRSANGAAIGCPITPSRSRYCSDWTTNFG